MRLKRYSNMLIALGAVLAFSILFSNFNLYKIAGDIGGGVLESARMVIVHFIF